MVMVTGEDVAAFLGRGDDAEVVSLAQAHLPVVTAFIHAYTRGHGFVDGSPEPGIEAVLTAATARLTSNPSQSRQVQVADVMESPAILNGFTLPELAILHLYRRRTA